MSIIYFLLIGLIAGWLAGLIMKTGNSSWIRNLIVGVIGAVLGGFLFGLLGIGSYSLLGSLVTATVGAIIFLALVNKFLAGKLPF